MNVDTMRNMAIDTGGYVYEQSSRINCSIWLDVSDTVSE